MFPNFQSNTIQSNYEWLTFNIYYPGNYNFFLKTMFPEFLNFDYDKFNISNFFFINYFDGAQHLRLRYKVHRMDLSRFILEYSSFLDNLSITRKNNITQTKFLIKRGSYEKEYERYFGVSGLEIAEEFFYYSSEFVLTYHFESVKTPLLESLISASLWTILAICEIFFKDINHKLTLLKYCREDWISAASIANSGIHRNDIIIKYDRNFNNQKKELMSIYESTKTEIKAIVDKDVGGDFFSEFINNMNVIKKKLSGLSECNPDTSLENLLFHLLRSYIHLHQNRLGIPNNQESYLSHLAYKIISNDSATNQASYY